ncbi:hypothetical protein C0Q70_10011 [Pomacea canaliculata]|uniref:VWFC domain-containing protein n=1 Tax=Pomacea canaliculata TaxID=400727 RepID=A0A2T7PBE8_POMCA|nr:uncharacterized protein LOC112564854 [Pomacea canaliculata]PVD30736.1 hypothetical protein C0Q70_10011 [Pomacea canaliculata]
MSPTTAAAAAAVLLVVCLFCKTDALPRRSYRFTWLRTTTTTPAPTTAPTIPECVTDTGIHLQVGESHKDFGEGWCRICECTFEGLTCIHGDCLPPMCVDYIRGDCCYYCPNGQNCRLPSGELITGPVELDGMSCKCPEQEYYLPGVPADRHTIAICTPTTTISTPTIKSVL